MKLISCLSALAFGSMVAACAPADESVTTDTSDVSDNAIKGDSVTGDTVYVVTGRDYRKCAAPMCGGFFVKAVNKLKTTCIDGTKQPECYVAAIDDAALGLSGAQREKFLADLEAGQHIAAATIAPLDDTHPGIGKLALSKGYEDASANETTGAYFLVQSSGIVCITTPCPTISTTRLNTGTQRNVTDVDFSSLGVSQDAIEKALAMINQSSLIVSGRIVAQGNEVRLVASDFFTTVEPTGSGLELCLHDGACGENQICDMTTCHSNCPPGMVCPAVCWGECVDVSPIDLCYADDDCSAGQVCDFTTCHNDCPPGMVCPAVCQGECVAQPPLQLCLSDSACDAGEFCDHSVCYSNCPPGQACPDVCWGACGTGTAQ